MPRTRTTTRRRPPSPPRPPCRSAGAGLAALLGAIALSSPARAEPLPLERTVRLGRPARPVAVRLEQTDEGPRLTLDGGGRSASSELPGDELASATLERIEVAADHHVAVLQAEGAGALRVAAVVGLADGRPSVLWVGRTDLHGDPGERTRAVLSLEDRTGDGRPDVLVGLEREGAALCGVDETPPAMARAYDPGRGTMRPVLLRRLPAERPVVAVTATRQSPGPTDAPLLPALAFTGASSTSGRGEDPSAMAPPRALADGDPSTFWAEGRGGAGRGEYVTARWSARFPIRAIALTAAATGEAGEALGRPQELTLVGDAGPLVRVTLPEDAAMHPGERYWVVPPEPLPWRCLSLVLDRAYSPRGTSEAATHTGLAEVEVYTDLDFGRGVQDLVSILIEQRGGGDEAARLLESLGEPAVSALVASWERLAEQGRRRAVRVFRVAARRGSELAVDALARAAQDDAEPVRQPALEALGALGDRAGGYLAEIVRNPGPAADEAVRPLLRHRATLAVPALLDALADEGGSERSALRDGLAHALSRGDGEARARFEAWTEQDPPTPALASAILGLASRDATRSLARPLLGGATQRASDFSTRWRLVQAAGELPADPAVDAWLAQLVDSAEEWMLRAAAVEALGRRDSELRAPVARRAMSDDYPRVRVEAVRVLDALDAADEVLSSRARSDSWPMVREAAVRALWNRPAGREAVRRGVRDRSPRVRVGAIESIARAGDRQAWPLVRARLEDGEEWPQVTIAALTYVREQCLTEASEQVLGVVHRGTRQGAWAPDVDVAAVAADLAVRLGGEAAEEVARLATLPSTPASVRAAVQRRQGDAAQGGTAQCADE